MVRTLVGPRVGLLQFADARSASHTLSASEATTGSPPSEISPHMPSRHFGDHAEDALSSDLYPSEQSNRSLSILDTKLLPTCVSRWRIAFNACCRPLQASMG